MTEETEVVSGHGSQEIGGVNEFDAGRVSFFKLSRQAGAA